MELAQRIKNKRLELNLSISQVALSIGVPSSSYIEWENGRKITGERIYPKLSEALGIGLSELILGEVNPVNDHLRNIEKIIEKIRYSI